MGPIGAFPSLAHFSGFVDSSLQTFLPTRWRWVFTFVPMSNDAMQNLLPHCGTSQWWSYGLLIGWRTFVAQNLCDAERAWQGESLLKMGLDSYSLWKTPCSPLLAATLLRS